MLLICASEVQKHRRISKNLATRTTTQMLVTAESTPPWTLTSGDHHHPPLKQQLPESKQRPSRSTMANSSKSTNGWSMSSVKRYAQSAPNNRQNSADPDKSEQRKVRINKSNNKKKQTKLRAEMISSPRPPSSTGKLDDASNRNEKNEDRKQKHGNRNTTAAGNETTAAASGGAPAAGKTGGGGRKVAVSSISTNVKKQRTADANYQHPWLYTTLKGHTGQVFDMDFSRNGKYLATCAEDSPSAQSSSGNHLINVNINANDERTTKSSAFSDVNDVVSSSSSSSSSSSGSSTRGEDSPNTQGAGKKQRKYTKKKQQYKKSNGNSSAGKAGNCATNLRVCSDDDPATESKVVNLPVNSTAAVAQSASSSSLSSSSSSSSPVGGSSSSGGKQHHYHQHDKNSSCQGRLDSKGGRTSPQRGAVDNSKRYHQRNAGLSPLRQYVKLNLSENELVKYLDKYVLDKDVMKELGFPVEYGLDSDKAIIYKFPHDFFRPAAAQFYPRSAAVSSKKRSHEVVEADKSDDTDSGHSSPTNVDDSDSLLMYRSLSQSKSTALKSPLSDLQLQPSEERECCRCNKGFFITLDGEYLTQEHCIYHWGRLTRVFSGTEFKKTYSCCNGDADVKGCTINKLHVWTGLLPGFNGPFDGFVKTQPSPRKLKLFEKLLLNKFYYQNMNADCIDLLQQEDLIADDSESDGVYALDCEMSYTGRGLELTKVTVVSVDGQLVYERFVKPEIEIVDYNTRYSGVTEADFANPRNYVTLRQVQRDLLKFIYDDTILIGHAIENDLKVLKIIHKTVIDTSITFPHMNGFPFRQSLKSLTKNILKRDIQQQQEQPVFDIRDKSSSSSSNSNKSNSIGHCSLEDSRASLELMLWRVRKDKAVYENIWNNSNCYRMQNN